MHCPIGYHVDLELYNSSVTFTIFNDILVYLRTNDKTQKTSPQFHNILISFYKELLVPSHLWSYDFKIPESLAFFVDILRQFRGISFSLPAPLVMTEQLYRLMVHWCTCNSACTFPFRMYSWGNSSFPSFYISLWRFHEVLIPSFSSFHFFLFFHAFPIFSWRHIYFATPKAWLVVNWVVLISSLMITACFFSLSYKAASSKAAVQIVGVFQQCILPVMCKKSVTFTLAVGNLPVFVPG